MPDEPAKDAPDCFNLNFRLPVSGERVSRRFHKDDKVAILYTYIDYLTQNGDCSFEDDINSMKIGTQCEEHLHKGAKYQIVQAIGPKR